MSGDLAWFPFFVDDWLGGTLSMSQAELGAYLQALIQQWKSGDLQAIKDSPRAINIICRGRMISEVRNKFVPITVESAKHLRNIRLFEIYQDQQAKHKRRVERAVSGAQARHKQSISTAASTQNPEPRSSLSTKKESKSHSPKAEADPRSQHPAIAAMRVVMERFPDKHVWDGLISVLGQTPDVDKLHACYVEWIGRGYNKNSIKWTDWMKTGIPTGNGKRQAPRIELLGDGPGWE